MKNVTVVGAGYMGCQIALQCAAHGRDVRMQDSDPKALERSASVQERLLDEQIEAGTVAAGGRAGILGRIRRATSVKEAAADADLVIEAVKEDLEVKLKVFAEYDKACGAGAVLATNSSAIRISLLEPATSRPDRMVNTHFVTPVWKHPFVELMGGSATSPGTLRTVGAFMESVGMLPIYVRKESTGFVFNRIWRAVKKESLRVVDQGVATAEDVDRAWMIQMEAPLGPCALMDRIGLDVVADIERIYERESGDPGDAPPKVLLDMIARGELGEKTGKGFYSYPDPAWRSPEFLKTASPFDSV